MFLFSEILNDYQTQLELFEEIEFQEFAELGTGGFEDLKVFGSPGAIPTEVAPVVELVETGFASLNEQAFTELDLTVRS